MRKRGGAPMLMAFSGPGPQRDHRPTQSGPSVYVAVAGAIVGVIVGFIIFLMYRPDPGMTFGLILVSGLGAVVIAVGGSLLWHRWRGR